MGGFQNIPKGIISGGLVRDLSIDKSTRANKVVQYDHSEVHSGDAFVCTQTASVTDSSQKMEWIISVSDTSKDPHATLLVDHTRNVVISLYEDTSRSTTGGSTLTVSNKNRNSSNTAETVITGRFDTDGFSGGSDGNLIWSYINGENGTPSGRSIIEGQSRGQQEWILKQNTNYLLRISVSTNVGFITNELNWYEHTEKE